MTALLQHFTTSMKMAEEHPSRFCFICNSPYHLSYQCQQPGPSIPASGRKKILRELDPAATAREQRHRNQKKEEVEEYAAKAQSVSMQDIKNEVNRLLDVLDEIQCRDVLTVDQEFSMDEESCMVDLENIVDVERDARAVLGDVRGIAATAFKRLKGKEDNRYESDILRGKVRQLQELRDSIWSNIQQRKARARNVQQTVMEFMGIYNHIDDWCRQFSSHVSANGSVNFETVDEQLIAHRSQLEVLSSRARFLRDQAGLGNIPFTLGNDLLGRVRKARKLRLLYETKLNDCPICNSSTVSSFFLCGHGACQGCRDQSGSCRKCGARITDVDIEDFYDNE